MKKKNMPPHFYILDPKLMLHIRRNKKSMQECFTFYVKYVSQGRIFIIIYIKMFLSVIA